MRADQQKQLATTNPPCQEWQCDVYGHAGERAGRARCDQILLEAVAVERQSHFRIIILNRRIKI